MHSISKHKDTQGNKKYTAKEDGMIWHLVCKMDENSADEEVVALLQGILCKKDIAPFNEKNT